MVVEELFDLDRLRLRAVQRERDRSRLSELLERIERSRRWRRERAGWRTTRRREGFEISASVERRVSVHSHDRQYDPRILRASETNRNDLRRSTSPQ